MQTELVYKSTPSRELKLYVHPPADWRASDRRSAVVLFFGGGWHGRNLHQQIRQCDRLAEEGLVAFRADYRVRSTDPIEITDCIGDARSAIRYLRANAASLGVDADRIVSGGGSAGAHIATCCSVFDRYDDPGDDLSVSCAPQALMCFNPVMDLDGWYETENEYTEVSPVHEVGASCPPIIMFYGTLDRALAGGQRFTAKVNECGGDARLQTFDGQGHGFYNSEPYTTRTLDGSISFLRALGFMDER